MFNLLVALLTVCDQLRLELWAFGGSVWYRLNDSPGEPVVVCYAYSVPLTSLISTMEFPFFQWRDVSLIIRIFLYLLTEKLTVQTIIRLQMCREDHKLFLFVLLIVKSSCSCRLNAHRLHAYMGNQIIILLCLVDHELSQIPLFMVEHEFNLWPMGGYCMQSLSAILMTV